MTIESQNLYRNILNTREVLIKTGVSRATLYATLLKTLGFPKPFKLGLRSNAWFLADVDAWIAARAEMAA